MPTTTTNYTPAMVMKVLRNITKVPSGCIEWTGTTNGVGYGVVTMRDMRFYTHRLSYMEAFGPIPDGLVIDHLCRNTLCLRPDHLEAVTQRENTLRGITAQKESCVRGHPFDDANTYITLAGHRACRTCRRLAEQRRRARLKENNPWR